MKPGARGLPQGLAALGERNFALYTLGHFTTQSGNWLETTATNWILYELTDSAFLLGVGALCRAAPVLLLTLIGGAVADRVPRRRLLLVTESTQLLLNAVVALFAATGHLAYWHLYLLNLSSGALSAFSVPTRQAMFPGLVPRHAVASAVAMNAVAVRSSALVGPAIAGVALAASGFAAPFVLNAISFLGMLAALLAMRLPPSVGSERPRGGLRQGVVDGVRFVWEHPLLRVLLGLEVLISLFGHNTPLITILARDRLGSGPEGLALLISSLAGGALTGMLLVTLVHTERRGLLVLAMSSLYVLLLVGFALSPWLLLSAFLLYCLGAADGVSAVSRNTVAQLAVPDHLRGRVMSVVVLITRGVSMLGGVQSGMVAALVGGPLAALLGAAVVGGGVAAAAVRGLALREFRTSRAVHGDR